MVDTATKLVVIIPAYNEEKTVGDVVTAALRPIEGVDRIEVLVVNDKSTDGTKHVAEAAGATVIDLHRREGLGVVFRRGLLEAIRRRADVIVSIDGDGQFNAADIPALIGPILADEADFVTCTRFKHPDYRPQMPRAKYWGNFVVTRLINLICGRDANFTDVSCGFRAFGREASHRLTLFGNFTYTQEVFIDLYRKGMRIMEAPLKVRGGRQYGRSRVASSLWRYAVQSSMIILRVARDTKPLKFFGGLGGLGLVGFVLLSGALLGWYAWTGRTSPFTSLIIVDGVLLIFAIQMIIVGLLADMIGRHRVITEELLYMQRQRAYNAPAPTELGRSAQADEPGGDEEGSAPVESPAYPGEPIIRRQSLAKFQSRD